MLHVWKIEHIKINLLGISINIRSRLWNQQPGLLFIKHQIIIKFHQVINQYRRSNNHKLKGISKNKSSIKGWIIKIIIIQAKNRIIIWKYKIKINRDRLVMMCLLKISGSNNLEILSQWVRLTWVPFLGRLKTISHYKLNKKNLIIKDH